MRIITTKQLKEIPRRIIYSKAYNETTQYNMADTKTGKLVGRMYGNMEREFLGSTYYPTIDYYDSFFIHLLDIKEKKIKTFCGKFDKTGTFCFRKELFRVRRFDFNV